jgi:alkylation response protein AidB-like acyl-CoA dehydrogenase
MPAGWLGRWPTKQLFGSIDTMRLAMTEEQLALRETVRLLLSRESGSAAVRSAAASRDGFDRALWARLCAEVGVAGLAVPESCGGLGAGLAEVHVVLAELGRALTPCPMLGSAVLAAQAILASGDEQAGRRLLPGIAAGTTIAALAWVGPDGHWDPGTAACSAAPTSTVDWVLTGEARHVLDGAAAEVLIVVARTGAGLALFEVDPVGPGVHRTRVPAMDLTRNLATVRLSGAPGRRLGSGDGLGHVRDVACAALAAEQVGTARRCLELTVDYTGTRVQFGRPVGGFQALKHRMADMHVLVETAESAALAAAVADPDELPLAAAVAKVHCSEALCAVAAEMIQLHGGIAITWEHDAHLYFKRAHGSAQLFGQPREHVARITG